MNKTVIIGAVVIVLAGLGYYQFSVVPAQKAAQEAAQKAEDEAAAKAAEEAAAAAAKKAEDDAAAAAKAAEEAAAKAAQDAAAAATTAATTATTAAQDATAAATTAVSDAATQAMELLDPAKFDADKLTALIDGSQLDDATKGTLKSAVAAAKANPALVDATVAQIKTALGL